MVSPFCLLLILVPLLVLAGPEEALAWGPGVHTLCASYVLAHLALLPAAVAEVIGRYPLDFVFGSLSADLFWAKNYRPRAKHCHNWQAAQHFLDLASTEADRAMGWGYLVHLAADVLAHNYYVPHCLCASPGLSPRLDHFYCEAQSDTLAHPGDWELAKAALSQNNGSGQTLLVNIVPGAWLTLRAEKWVLRKHLHLSERPLWQQSMDLLWSWSGSPEEEARTRRLVSLSQAAALDVLVNPQTSVCQLFDPRGRHNLRQARRDRRRALFWGGPGYERGRFEVAGALVRLARGTEGRG